MPRNTASKESAKPAAALDEDKSSSFLQSDTKYDLEGCGQDTHGCGQDTHGYMAFHQLQVKKMKTVFNTKQNKRMEITHEIVN